MRKTILAILVAFLAPAPALSQTNPPPIVCPTPTGLTATFWNATQITMGWNSVSEAIEYNLRYKVSGTGSWTTVSTTSTGKTVSGLTPGTSYEFQVQSRCSTIDYSGYSSSAYRSTLTPSPTGLNSTATTTTSITVAWDSMTGASSYDLQYKMSGAPSWTTLFTIVGTSTTVGGLNPDTTYEFKVQAQYSVGASGYSGSISVATNPLPTVATPSISPTGGTYADSVTVSLSVATSGAEIRYTLDGSTPTSSSTLYGGAFSLTSTTTVQAKGFKSGYNTSGTASATYTITVTPTVATPSISPSGGTYADSVTVSLSVATSGAEIRYTLDGSTPTAGSTLYTGSFSLTSTTTVQARGFKSGYNPSGTASAIYTITVTPTVATPSISPSGGTYADSVTVSLSVATSGAEIRYTLDGSTPTAGSTLYSGAFSLTSTTTVQARGFKSGYNPSGTASAIYTITTTPTVATPSISPSGGTYADSVTVSLSVATSGAEIRYTLDGSTPTAGSALYTGPFNLFVSANVKAAGFKAGYNPSGVASVWFTITTSSTVATPVIDPSGGGYNDVVGVRITVATPGADIRFTTDGTTPTAGSPLYTGPFDLVSSATVQARGFKNGYNPSGTAFASFTIIPSVAIPAISPSDGAYIDSVVVSMSTATGGAEIRYTTDGSAPTAGSALYTGPFALNSSATVQARGFKSGYNPSPTSFAMLTVVPTVATPAISPAGGSYPSPVSVSLSTSTTGADIRYTTDGSVPDSGSTLYTGPFAVAQSATVTAMGFKSGYNPSGMASETYTIESVQTVAWSAVNQMGSTYWYNSGMQNYTMRVLVEGSYISQGGGTVVLKLQPRTSGSYTIQRVSLVKRDGTSGSNGIDSTFTQVTFGSTWDAGATVPAGTTIASDPVAFDLQPGQDVFVTFWVPPSNPTVYLYAGSQPHTWFAYNSDQSATIDWSGLSTSTSYGVYAAASLEVSGAAPPPPPPSSDYDSFTDFTSGYGDWSNTSGDVSDWLRRVGQTTSYQTGPNGDHTTGSGYYAHVETSYGYAYYSGDEVFLLSPWLDADDYALTLEFFYHMYGATMGTLFVDIFHDGSWELGVWSRTGQQHPYGYSPWSLASVSLESYSGSIRVRFRGRAAGGYQGDMAIDDVRISGPLLNPTGLEVRIARPRNGAHIP